MWVGVVLSGVFLYLAFHKVDPGEIGSAFRNANYVYVIPCLIMSIVGMWLRALRWKFLLDPVKKIRMGSLFSSTMIGFMANNLLPARLGEFVRAWVIGEKEGIPKSASFATIVVERLFDGVAVLTFLFMIVLLHPFTLPVWLQRSAAAIVIFYMATLAFLLALKFRTDRITRCINFVLRPFPDGFSNRLRSLLESFIRGLQILHDWKNIMIVLVLSFIIWFPVTVVIDLLLRSLGIVLPFLASFLVLIVLVVGVMVPSAPGFVGTIQLASVAALSLFGVGKGQALTFSLLFHAIQYIPVTTLGLVFFFLEGYSLKQLKRSGEAAQSENDDFPTGGV